MLKNNFSSADRLHFNIFSLPVNLKNKYMIEKFDFMNDYYDDFLLCIRNNDRDGMWRCGYNWYMNDESMWSPELGSVSLMAFDTRLKVDALNNMNYYFETIGDYSKAEDAVRVKKTIQNSFRNMITLLKINKPQFN